MADLDVVFPAGSATIISMSSMAGKEYLYHEEKYRYIPGMFFSSFKHGGPYLFNQKRSETMSRPGREKNMIYTVTFNPAIDYVVHIGDIALGMTNRSEAEEMYFGGKGINVSMVAGFVAGSMNGDYEYALKLGTATGGATAFSEGLATKALVDELLLQLQ